MINCVPKQVKRGAIQFGPHSYMEIRSLIGNPSMDDHKGQALVNTKRHGWQNVNYGDYLVFDEENRGFYNLEKLWKDAPYVDVDTLA